LRKGAAAPICNGIAGSGLKATVKLLLPGFVRANFLRIYIAYRGLIRTKQERTLKPILKMSFGPISLLEPRLKSSIRLRRTSGLRPTDRIRSDGKSRVAGKPGSAAILNQNPIFELGFNKKSSTFMMLPLGGFIAMMLFVRWDL